MPTIEITIPTSHMTRVVDAIADNHNYQALIDGELNPETRNQFAKRMAAEWVKANLVSHEARLAADAARDASITDTEGVEIT